MRQLDFYEFVGVFVPGVVLLSGVVLVFAMQLPDDLGGSMIFFVVAYAAGHLLQGFGDLFEWGYWWLWSGMPTDWPFTKPQRLPASYAAALLKVCSRGETPKSVSEWREMVSVARAILVRNRLAERLQVFNGNYGMSRGIVVASLLLIAIAWLGTASLPVTYGILVAMVIVAAYRMQRFAKHYCQEFFASISALSVERDISLGNRN